jgi:hypothetical protein
MSVSLGSDERETNMEIANSTSIVRTPGLHGRDAHITDMDIEC